VGRYRFAQFGDECLRLMRADEPYVVEDSETDPRVAEVRESYRQTLIRSVICVPLHKSGRFVAAMAVHCVAPRRWTGAEARIVQRVADRCWESIERARIARELRQQYRTFDTALSHTPDSTYIFDRDGRFRYMNQALLTLLRLSFAEAVGKNFHELGYPPELATRLHAHIQQVIASRGQVRDVTPFTGPDGTTRHYEYIFVPVFAEDGSVEAVAGSTRDITERMRGEAELREANAKLSRTNRELEQYAYITSHDLQEPLRMVGNYMELIERRAGKELSEPMRRYIGRAREATVRMQSLIRDLLAFARVGEHGPFAEVDLGAVVAQAVENLQAAIAQAGATVTVGPLPKVWGGEMILVLLFQNLIGNAIKFRSPERTPAVRIDAARGDDGWIIAVRDNGIGIPAAHQQRIFEVFQRLHSQSEYEGTGIGLAICRKIAEQHRGRILVESIEGGGSTFSIVIGDAPA